MSKKSHNDFVQNLDSQRNICSTFAVLNKTIRTASTGRNYIDLTLTDKTGRISGRIFPDNNVQDVFDSIVSGGICKIWGNVTEFPPQSGKYNIVINSLEELSEEDYHLDDFIRTSSNDQDQLRNEIRSTIKKISNPELKNLLKTFFCDDQFTERFFQCPAAKIHHHNYLGGLLDHTVEVLRLCKTILDLFPDLDSDLLCTGALLHDIGKIRAYDYDQVKIEMSPQGLSLGHMYLSAEMVKEKINDLDISDELSDSLLHLILSHHGKVAMGWGSVIDPKTPEAVALHYADNLDARVKEMFQK